MNMKKFSTVHLEQGPIYISYAKQGLFFSKGATRALHYAHYACMKLDLKDKEALFLAARAKTSGAVPFYHNRRLPGARWSYTQLDQIMQRMMGWNSQYYAYRVPCLYLSEKDALFADFKHYKYIKIYDPKKHEPIAPHWKKSTSVNLDKNNKKSK